MNVLAVETSAKSTSVCIVADCKILSEFSVNAKLAHSQTLMPMVESALHSANISLDTIDAFAVSCGPGSFTGLRIGIGAVKGMAFALNKPCVAVSTLHALATNLSGYRGIVCPVMDARCAQVYMAIFRGTADGTISRISTDDAITITALKELLQTYDEDIFLVGDGAELCYSQLSSHIDGLYLASPILRFQRASSVGLIGCGAFQDNMPHDDICSSAQLMPNYLRLPQAERERLAKL